MALHFATLCHLFSQIEDVTLQELPIILEKDKAIEKLIKAWFQNHRQCIKGLSVHGTVALLSACLPQRRTDRVYGIQAPRLCKILSRCLGLSLSRARDLQAYTEPGRGDLATCLQRVLKAGGTCALPPVTLQEIDDMLQALAGGCRFSGPAIPRVPSGSSEARDNRIAGILNRVTPEEGKWLVRLVLKDLSPSALDETSVLHSYHFLAPGVFRFQNDLHAVVRLLEGSLRRYPEAPDRASERLHFESAAKLLRPVVGVKVGRPNFVKARSIDNCLRMTYQRRYVLERKYDGEYCEIHVDCSRLSAGPAECIKIFSKSGKDSTMDRNGIHAVLVQALRLGRPDCKIQRQAILLGEIVVYSDQRRCIMPFEEIRKHVSRSGCFLGTDADSPPKKHEHLAIVFFDILLLDDEAILNRSVEERRNRLRQVYEKLPGKAIGSEWKIVDFAEARAKRSLGQQFAASVAERCEGLILKPCGVPYLSLDPSCSLNTHSYIKLKKDYINGFGDEADFAVIGAHYDPQHALSLGLERIAWTSFVLACLTNKAAVQRSGARPRFRVVASIEHPHCIPKVILTAANSVGQFRAASYNAREQPEAFDLEAPSTTKLKVVFAEPMVFEVLGSGFVKPPNTNYYMLRHPRVKKLHQDRTFRDCVSFTELQDQAVAANTVPADAQDLETKKWFERLEQKSETAGRRGRLASIRLATPSQTTPVSSGERGGSVETDARTTHSTPSAHPDRCLEQTWTDATPCATKRRPDLHEHITGWEAKKPRQNEHKTSPAETTPTREMARAPLANITNSVTPPKRAGASLVAHEDGGVRTKGITSPQKGHAFGVHHGRADCTRLARGKSPVLCQRGSCLLADAVVFLSPCIATTPYIAEDLLCSHNALLTNSLDHWDRDVSACPALSETVSESQSYADMRKVVLVESRRPAAVRQILQQILDLNDGRFRERVEVYDWRVLERCVDHDLDPSAAGAKTHFVGATMFDWGLERSIFVGEASFSL